MKQRVISAAVGILLVAVAAFLMDSVLFNILIFAVMLLCIHEITSAVGQKKLYGFLALMAAFSAVFAFVPANFVMDYFYIFISVFTMLYYTIAILYSKRISLANSAIGYFIYLMYMLGLFAWVSIKAQFGTHGDGVFLFIVTLAFPLLGDMFAFFVGRAIGKKKLCEHISPNKTVAGAVAAVVAAPFYSCLCLFIYSLTPAFKGGMIAALYSVDLYIVVAVLGAVVAFFGIFGDLTSSAVKRYCGIKDFGRIMPGHGGVADRLDSVCFTAPLVAAAFLYLTGFFA